MGMIAAKCTQCGSNITVDDNLESGVCEYCGTIFRTEKTVKNYITDITNNFSIQQATLNFDQNANINNWRELATRAFAVENFQETENYCIKIIEASPSDVESNLRRSVCCVMLSSIAKSRVSMGIQYFKIGTEFAFQNSKYDFNLAHLQYFTSMYLSIRLYYYHCLRNLDKSKEQLLIRNECFDALEILISLLKQYLFDLPDGKKLYIEINEFQIDILMGKAGYSWFNGKVNHSSFNENCDSQINLIIERIHKIDPSHNIEDLREIYRVQTEQDKKSSRKNKIAFFSTMGFGLLFFILGLTLPALGLTILGGLLLIGDLLVLLFVIFKSFLL